MVQHAMVWIFNNFLHFLAFDSGAELDAYSIASNTGLGHRKLLFQHSEQLNALRCRQKARRSFELQFENVEQILDSLERGMETLKQKLEVALDGEDKSWVRDDET